MGLYLRKSFKFGPLRVNASKSGLGASVGVKGARLGVNSKGRPYVCGGRDGLYYKEFLDSAPSSPSMGISLSNASFDGYSIKYHGRSKQELWTHLQQDVTNYEDTVKFYCSSCQQRIEVNSSAFGQIFNCPVCNEVLTVPAPIMISKQMQQERQLLYNHSMNGNWKFHLTFGDVWKVVLFVVVPIIIALIYCH